MSIVALSNVSKSYSGDPVLRNVSFRCGAFEKMAFAGETGSGKSTLLKIIAGLLAPDSGTVSVSAKRVLGPDERLVAGEPGVAYLSQQHELPKSLRVGQVLEYARALPLSSVRSVYRVCRIDHLVEHKTSELSGGEQQRIALALALVKSPFLLLLDEPYSNLDAVHKAILKEVIDDVAAALKITCILVSHDPAELLPWAERIAVMRKGRIIQTGTPQEIYNQPATEYAAGLFGKYNLVSQALAIMLFQGEAGIQPRIGKRVLVRPERLVLANGQAGGIPGSVKSAQYCGSFTDYCITAADAELIIRSNTRGLIQGDAVRIAAR